MKWFTFLLILIFSLIVISNNYSQVNQEGNIVYHHIGETHQGDRKALALEKKIKQLLAK